MISQIGPYQITRELGRGGMGVVYLATDTRLNRQVAIKALPAEWASDPLRLDRFQREAKTLASLNHPEVAGIYGVEELEGAQYLVLEYVAGQTLAEMLDGGPLPVDDVIELAVQIAAGVEAAHEAGVIHRDLKPANIIVTPDGKAKVLDFGLARTDDSSSSSVPSLSPDSPTITSPAAQHSPTMPGVILGTAAYMSPEQARGRRVDKRTDIWSFGVVLYEMLTGASPFVGETVSDSIGAVLHKDLELDRLPPQTPANVRRVLDRCLVRDRNLRFRDIGDVRLELLRTDEQPIARAEAGRSLPLWLIPAVLAGLVTVALAVWMLQPAVKPSPPAVVQPVVLPVVQADIALPGDLKLAHSFVPGIAISADGRTLAFAAGELDAEDEITETSAYFRGGLYIRRLGEPDAVPVAGAEHARQPAFSPDGSRLAYMKPDNLVAGKIETIAVTGGRPTTLALGNRFIVGLDWSEDGRIVFGTNEGLRSIPEAGGAITELTAKNADAEEMIHAFPHVLPGGVGILYTVAMQSLDPAEITVRVLDMTSGESRELLKNASNARYARGQLVFARKHMLHAIPFDLETLTLGGEARPLGLSVVQSHWAPNRRVR
jgi:eukaryotic-like serine/threonine-protein kinase